MDKIFVTDKGCSGKWVTRIEKMRNPSKSILHILIFLIIIETGRSIPKLLSAYEWTARINISGYYTDESSNQYKSSFYDFLDTILSAGIIITIIIMLLLLILWL
jgi:hypothetical protein